MIYCTHYDCRCRWAAKIAASSDAADKLGSYRLAHALLMKAVEVHGRDVPCLRSQVSAETLRVG